MEQQNMQKNTTQDGLNQLEAIEHIIFGLSKENISQSVDLINNKIDEIYQTSFNLIISQMVYIVFRIKMNDIDVYLNFIDEIDKFEKNNNYNSKIMDVFTHYLLNEDTQESNYILYSMIENNMLEPETVITRNYACFAHYMTKERINSMKYEKFINQVKENYEELSKNDWELHKKLIKEGVNPNEIAKIIRYDEIEKLQEISSQTNFDFNQTIEPSLYERCSFINKENVPLIDYAAFFSAIKCFKYLLINGTKLTNTGKYAVAGGNLEIIHLCEQNHATFKDAYETAIEFHKNNIFHYLDENKFIMFFDFVVLGKQCILYHNYEIFSFLEKEGMKIDDDIMNETVSRGNLFLTKYLLKEKHPKKYLLFNSLISGNTELVKFILDKGVNINSTDSSLNTALIFASESGQIDIVKLLLDQKGIDVNAKNNYKETALMRASYKGYIEVVKLLLEQKEININFTDRWGETALMKASENGYIEIVKLLLEQKGIDINIQGLKKTALTRAAENGYADIVRLLLEQKGIEVNNEYYGKTELMLAAQNGHAEIVKLLLEHEGVDINAQDDEVLIKLRNPETYDSDYYQNRVYNLKKFNNYIFSIIFFLNLLITITIGSYAIHKVPTLLIQKCLGLSFIFGFVGILFNFLFMWLLPEQYLKYSIFIGPIFGIIGVILGFLYGYKIAIGIYIFMAIVVTFAFFFSRHDLFFSRALLQMSIRTQFIKYFPNFILLSVHIVVVSCIAVFYSYSHIAILLLDSISSYAVVYMFLSIIWIINTYCNIVYMISSSTSAAYYFTSSTAREIKIPILRSLLRCCILNVGCAAREAVLVPITQYIHTVARLAPGPTLEKIFHKNDAKPLIKALKKLSYIASIFMKPLDLLLGYPTRQGLIYSSMFGVPYDEGCLRFAEISAKYYCNLLNEIQTIGTNLACHSLNIILIAVTTVVPTCNKLGQYSNVSIPFIFAYAIANAFRQMLRGHYETILVAFSECPNRMKTINREVEEILEQQYGTELQTRCFRQSNQFEDETVE